MKKAPLRNNNGMIESYEDACGAVKDYFAESGRKLARYGELESLGVKQTHLRTMKRKKVIVQDAYGIYALADWVRNEMEFEAQQQAANIDAALPSAAAEEPNSAYLEAFAEVSAKVPRAVISLLSASAYHNLTLDVPFQIWIALEHGSHPPKIEYPPIRSVMRRLKQKPGSLTLGVETVEYDGVPIRITDLERTVVDLYDYKKLPDPSMPKKALLAAMARPEFDREKLMKYARQLGVREKIRPDVEFADLMSVSRQSWSEADDDIMSMTL